MISQDYFNGVYTVNYFLSHVVIATRQGTLNVLAQSPIQLDEYNCGKCVCRIDATIGQANIAQKSFGMILLPCLLITQL